jgi:hypothetical protein
MHDFLMSGVVLLAGTASRWSARFMRRFGKSRCATCSPGWRSRPARFDLKTKTSPLYGLPFKPSATNATSPCSLCGNRPAPSPRTRAFAIRTRAPRRPQRRDDYPQRLDIGARRHEHSRIGDLDFDPVVRRRAIWNIGRLAGGGGLDLHLREQRGAMRRFTRSATPHRQ